MFNSFMFLDRSFEKFNLFMQKILSFLQKDFLFQKKI